MPRPRDRQSATGLLPRMEARVRKDGQITYRFHPLQADGSRGKPINLGTNIHEDIDVRCADETGAEEESLSITDQDKIELGQLVLDFLRGRAKVEWWGIDKKTEAGHTYVAGGDGGVAQ